jgi:3-deoxy-D-manno-octulosonic-acid transferase
MPGRPIWVQVCSLGEATAAEPLVRALQTSLPDHPILVTASTLAGRACCERLYGTDAVAWFPFDMRSSVRDFIERLNPAALVLFETELWPNVLAACGEREVPVLLANGRLSDKHRRRYERFRWWYGPLVAGLDAACMQEAAFKERLVALGVESERVVVTGSMKFDVVRDMVSPRERNQLRRAWGFHSDELILLFASTRPGDEDLASACWATLREENPQLRLVIAPRHPERIDDVLAPFSEPVLRRTAMKAGKAASGERVLVVDTLGELSELFAIAHVVVVGGSFYAGVNGHNPLEAAALGVPTLFGPYMSNFAVAERVLLEAGGAIQVGCPEDVYLELSTLLSDVGRQRQMGTAARRAVLENRGAVDKTVERLKGLIKA